MLTTGTLQQLVYLHERRVGERALVVGAEHVSFSAVATLAHGGARTVAMVTELPRHQSLALAPAGVRIRYGTKLWTRTRVTEILGRPRVEAVELTDVDTGRVRQLDCDTVVFTADWIPDNELAAMAGIELDPGTLGPAVDAALRTSRPGVFAAGNVLHGAEPADVAALSGRHAAASVARYLNGSREWQQASLRVVCHPPLHWISPNALSVGGEGPPRGHFALRSRDGPLAAADRGLTGRSNAVDGPAAAARPRPLGPAADRLSRARRSRGGADRGQRSGVRLNDAGADA